MYFSSWLKDVWTEKKRWGKNMLINRLDICSVKCNNTTITSNNNDINRWVRRLMCHDIDMWGGLEEELSVPVV